MALEATLLFVLVVSAATWFGGAIACTVIGSRIGAARDDAALGRFAGEYVQVAPGLFGGTGFLALVAGIWLVAVSDGLGFTVPWVLAALVLWFGSILFAATAVGFSWTRVATAPGHGPHVEGGARTPSIDSATAPALLARAVRLSWMDVAVRAVVVLLVVWQPG